MKSVYNEKENCCGCAACKQICPTKCIRMKEDANGYLYPIVDINQCIDCKACLSVCPIRNQDVCNTPQISYAYVNKNEEIRKNSASSGAFEALCRVFLHGVTDYSIYGCTLDENLIAKHCSVHNIQDISRMKKSKYIQSRMDNEYQSVLKELQEGKKVVFSGTPCQVAALKKFIKGEYENLLTIDLVCHGVPNQKIFSRYIKYLEKQNRAKVEAYTFRNKRKTDQQWTNLGVRADFVNGERVELEADEDLYMTGYLSGLFSRDSCYKCKYANLERVSDITIGDFWGIDKLYLDLSESKTNGTSLILGNTLKGKKTVLKIDKETVYDASLDDIIRENGQLKYPQEKSSRREAFLKAFRKNKGFKTCMKRAFPERYGFRTEKLYQMKFYVKLSKIKQSVLGKFGVI